MLKYTIHADPLPDTKYIFYIWRQLTYNSRGIRNEGIPGARCMGSKLCLKFQRAPLSDVLHKILNPYIGYIGFIITYQYAFYWLVFIFVIYDILEMWWRKP